ncbi:Lrp/AsnC family transcriptional regulator [Kutzneria sp. NPDC052558]|uniref:Lrp/AsnC family transcriptional regulator n=1 Tax=Kutzneria sp. NPDC052558 TaxID=3364121 RepID=UPI0037C5A1B6
MDATDHTIVRLLVEDGRRTVADIAAQVNMSASPVKRRIERLERAGMITGYTAVVDHDRLGAGFEAFVELRFAGDTEVEQITAAAAGVPEVLEIFTIAGDPDALVRVRADGVHHLRSIINELRKHGAVRSTKTLMVLGSWRRGGATMP